MSRAYPTWSEHSMVGKMGVMLWFAAFLVAGLAVVAVTALFVGAFVWALPGALWAERLWFALAGAGVVVALAWAWLRDR